MQWLDIIQNIKKGVLKMDVEKVETAQVHPNGSQPVPNAHCFAGKRSEPYNSGTWKEN